MRKCTQCKQEKEEELFKKRGDSRANLCKACHAANNRTGRPNLTKFKKGHLSWLKGIQCPEELKERLKIQGIQKGNIPWNKGKRYGETRSPDNGLYKIWKDDVHKRDGYKCVKCKSEKRLHAHHIVPWLKNESLRFDLENGMTLCNSCHAKKEGFQVGHTPKNKGLKRGKHVDF